MKGRISLTRVFWVVEKTLHRIDDAHDLRPRLRSWAGQNDNMRGPNPIRAGRAHPSSDRAPHPFRAALSLHGANGGENPQSRPDCDVVAPTIFDPAS